MSTTITNSLYNTLLGEGIPNVGLGTGLGSSATSITNWQSLNNVISGASANNVTLTFPNSQTLNRGRWRARVSAPGNASTTAAMNIFLADAGGNNLLVYQLAATAVPNANAASGVDVMHDFCIDIAANQITASVTVAGNCNANVDLECFGPA